MQFQPFKFYKVFLLLQNFSPSVKNIKICLYLIEQFYIYELAWTKKQETMML